MKRILINATHAEEIRVALCKGNHLYDFDLENRTREQKKSNIYKGHITRIEPSLEAVFVEYGSKRQGFLPIREIAHEYLSADPRSTNNIKQLVKEGDELIVQVEKEERGNKGAALSTYISLAGRYLVLMPNNPKGGGVSRQIPGKLREELKQMLSDLQLPKNMSVIARTAGIGKSLEELQNDLNHLLNTWQNIQYQNKNFPSPRLVHQEAGVVTRAIRDYLRDDIVEIWVDHESAYREAMNFIETTMPQQLNKLHKYLDSEPMFARFGIEKQIETAYQREVRLPSGGSIVIDQTEALVSIDINSAKSTKGSDVSETAYHTNLEAAEEIARQLRLRDIGGLIVIDFIDMATDEHQKDVENRIKDATKNDRARIQFAEISRFGLLEMSRQRLRPSLEEATGFLCPRCHGTGVIRDFRSMALSIMRDIEQRALQERQGELQIEVPIDIATFLLNEKRESLVYLEQDSGTRITILAQKHLKTPDFHITYHPDGFAPASYDRIGETISTDNKTNTQRQDKTNPWSSTYHTPFSHEVNPKNDPIDNPLQKDNQQKLGNVAQPTTTPQTHQSSAVAWLSNLFAPTPQAHLTQQISNQEVAAAMESIVNTGARSLGFQGQLNVMPQNIMIDSQPVSSTQPVTSPTTESSKTEQKTDNDNDKKVKTNPRPYVPKNKTKRPKTKPSEPNNQNKRENRADKPQSPTPQSHDNHSKPVVETTQNKATLSTTEITETTKKNEPEKKTNNPEQVTLKVYKIADNKPTTAIQLSLDNKPTKETQPTLQTVANSPINTNDTIMISDVITPKIVNQTFINRASNDPREVYKQFNQELNKKPPTKIRGTVGQFIQQYLPNANKNASTIDNFLLAFQQFQQMAISSNTKFNDYFKNYGYQKLTKENLEQYHAMINPVNQYHIDAGKTDCPPPPTLPRASNDPRGQTTINNNPPPATPKQPTPYLKGSVGEFLVNTLGDIAKQMIADGQLIQAYLMATLSPKTASTKTHDDHIIPDIEKEIMDLMTQLETHQDQATTPTEEVQVKTRTTPDIYKNMIESVSEQMGIINPMGLTLATPKTPKPRTRKAKPTEKTTPKTRTSKKVENATVTKKKATDETNDTASQTVKSNDGQ